MQIALGELGRHVLNASRAAPEQPVFMFLDELTYADKWDLWLKTFYDETWPLCLAGSSSSTAALRQRPSESDVGRWEEQYLARYSSPSTSTCSAGRSRFPWQRTSRRR
jgi:predicted AAA+ superfamily ATPase